MKKKIEFLLLAAVIVAAAAYLMLRTEDRTGYVLPELPEVSKKEITRIEILKGEKTVSLSQKEDRWFIFPAEFPADRDKTSDLLDSLARLTLSARVSETKNYERYDLGDDKKIHVKAFAGEKVLRDFAIGSTASTFRHTHVKIAGDPNVYQAQGNFKSKFDVTADALRDLTVLSFETTAVKELSLRFGEKSARVMKKNPPEDPPKGETKPGKIEPVASPKEAVAWETEDGTPVDEARLRRILGALANLKCQKFIQGRNRGDFRDPEIEIIVKADAEHSLMLFKKTDKEAKEQPGISSENASPFILADHQLQELRSLVQDLTRAK